MQSIRTFGDPPCGPRRFPLARATAAAAVAAAGVAGAGACTRASAAAAALSRGTRAAASVVVFTPTASGDHRRAVEGRSRVCQEAYHVECRQRHERARWGRHCTRGVGGGEWRKFGVLCRRRMMLCLCVDENLAQFVSGGKEPKDTGPSGCKTVDSIYLSPFM